MIHIQQFPYDAVNGLSYGVAEREPNAHSFDRISVIDDLGCHEQLMIPFAKFIL
jgi:hypothetical protein